MTDDVIERFRELRRTGDVALRNELVEEHAGFASYLARHFAHRGEPLDDLRQVALLGLVKAVERFDPDRGINFTSFAAPTITGEIKRHFRDRTWDVRVPRRLQELSLDIERWRGELGHELGRPPSVGEIAERAGVSEEAILEGMEAAGLYRLGSLDGIAAGDDEGPTPGDRIATHDDPLIGADDRLVLRELLETLPVRERRIVYMRYFDEMTQGEIAEQIGISQMHVSRLITKSLEMLAEQGGSIQRSETE